MKEGLWGIVNGTETPPDVQADTYAKFMTRRDRALATIVLSFDPSLLYLLGEPENPVTVCQTNFKRRHGRINWSFAESFIHCD